MNLKRLMSLMLALVLVLSMAACGSGEPAETNPDPVVLKTSIGEDRVQLQTDEAYGILM